MDDAKREELKQSRFLLHEILIEATWVYQRAPLKEGSVLASKQREHLYLLEEY